MSYLGRHARASSARQLVWDILRKEKSSVESSFTMQEFYERHRKELTTALSPVTSGRSVQGVVKGALQSLSEKGLVKVEKRRGEITYSTSLYKAERAFLRLSYGQAMVEAQRRRIL